ncbi:MAG: hypothetical protein JW944_03310 [Deltaproteobacteria bacterium]|nr:hypothetical protein [Deltaproteobacteria bacterium]
MIENKDITNSLAGKGFEEQVPKARKINASTVYANRLAHLYLLRTLNDISAYQGR